MNYLIEILNKIKVFRIIVWILEGVRCSALFIKLKINSLKGLGFIILGSSWLILVIQWVSYICGLDLLDSKEDAIFESIALVSDLMAQAGALENPYFEQIEAMEPNLVLVMLGCVVLWELMPLEPRDQ